jgi:hypothetical protein
MQDTVQPTARVVADGAADGRPVLIALRVRPGVDAGGCRRGTRPAMATVNLKPRSAAERPAG